MCTVIYHSKAKPDCSAISLIVMQIGDHKEAQ